MTADNVRTAATSYREDDAPRATARLDDCAGRGFVTRALQ